MPSREKIEQELINANIKVTDARYQILHLLHEKQGHYSAEEIHGMLAKMQLNVGLATIYRTLVQLEAVGLILRHSFMDGVAVYEINDGDHGHIVCLKCGNISEFNDEVINSRQSQIAQELKLEPIRCSHTLYGVCASCAK